MEASPVVLYISVNSVIPNELLPKAGPFPGEGRAVVSIVFILPLSLILLRRIAGVVAYGSIPLQISSLFRLDGSSHVLVVCPGRVIYPNFGLTCRSNRRMAANRRKILRTNLRLSGYCRRTRENRMNLCKYSLPPTPLHASVCFLQIRTVDKNLLLHYQSSRPFYGSIRVVDIDIGCRSIVFGIPSCIIRLIVDWWSFQ